MTFTLMIAQNRKDVSHTPPDITVVVMFDPYEGCPEARFDLITNVRKCKLLDSISGSSTTLVFLESAVLLSIIHYAETRPTSTTTNISPTV